MMREFLTSWQFITSAMLGVSIPFTVYFWLDTRPTVTELLWLATGLVFFSVLGYAAAKMPPGFNPRTFSTEENRYID